jgi:ATP-dependent Clp protease ATP-binding subunit ClpC
MPDNICDICHVRPAKHRVAIVRNGRQQNLELCDIEYGEVYGGGHTSSPLKVLIDMFDDNSPIGYKQLGAKTELPLSHRHEAIIQEKYLSKNAKEVLQNATEVAVAFKRHAVDTEHLLYALMSYTVIVDILKQFELTKEDIMDYIELNAPQGEAAALQPEHMVITVSQRIKKVVENAFQISRSLGHNYIGPKFLLIALATENDGIAGKVLRKYGLTPQALHRKTVSF